MALRAWKPRLQNLCPKKKMSEILIVGALFVLLLGAAAFYFYSRLTYTERKVGLLESILLDIKMTMEMEDDAAHDHLPAAMPTPPQVGGPAPAGGAAPPADEVSAEEKEFYNSVLSEVQNEIVAAATGDGLETVAEVPEDERDELVAPSSRITVNYEAMTRDELVALAEKKGLRTNKRMSKQSVVTLLRSSEGSSNGPAESGNDSAAVAAAAAAATTLEGSGGGAPLDMGMAEEIPLE